MQSVAVTNTAAGISVEIEGSQSLAVRTQVAKDPDRLILDFPNAVPAAGLHSKLINQGDIKGFRVARYSAKPLVTRVVIDLNSPQHYQIFPDGKTVIVKLTSDQQQAAAKAHLDNVSYTPPPAKPVPAMQVVYQNGRLSISAEHASLAEILNEVHRQTGTEITMPPGAAQEQIVANIASLPIREALVSLLNGSRFNFIMVDSETDPGKLKSVMLSYRGTEGAMQPAVPTPQAPVTGTQPEPEQPQPEPQPEVQQQPPDTPAPQDTPQQGDAPPPNL